MTTTVEPSARQLPDQLSLGAARLIVVDPIRSIAFYERVIGLTRLADTEHGIVTLGTSDGTVVLELLVRPDARSAGQHAGLYHVALLFPTRIELAHVLNRIIAARAPIDGASDHGTHEAIYLADPDGNGLELAVDRPRNEWPKDLGDIESIAPRPLDIDSLLGTASGSLTPDHAAAGLRVGHLHLHVGDLDRARHFYVNVIGFAPIMSIDTALFVAAAGYHHHLGLNTWKGQGVGPTPDDVVGLEHWTVLVPEVADLMALRQRLNEFDVPSNDLTSPQGVVVQDPWGIRLRICVSAPTAG